jgi:hypothetical protein
MASDDIPEQEQPEIIAKPPSHPITTSLLIVSCIGLILATGFQWNEVFGYYMLSPKVVDASMENHSWKKKEIQNHQGPIDHYSLDFQFQGGPEKTYQNLEYDVKNDLHLTQKQEEAAMSGSAAPDAPAPK